jgi:hypothetical protein
MTFPYDREYDEIEISELNPDWAAMPKKMETLEERAKKLENKLLIKAIRVLLPLVEKDKKIALAAGNTKLHNELLDVTWWFLEKRDQLLIENGENTE